MKAVLELASLFQVIPKSSRAPWQGGGGGQKGREMDCSPALPHCGIMLCNMDSSSCWLREGAQIQYKQNVCLSLPALQTRLKHGMWDNLLHRHVNEHHTQTGSRDKKHESPGVRFRKGLPRVSWRNNVLLGRGDQRTRKANEWIKEMWPMHTMEY